MKNIPFTKPFWVGKELDYVKSAVESQISGDGKFTEECQELMQKKFGAKKILLTTSCTHALEMSAMLLDIMPGDEVILPSFTFVSTVNAFVLRGAIPVFVDIREDTLNIDENLIEEKITEKTKVIVPVHYAGVCCEMNKIKVLARKHNLAVVEDAAQCVNSKYYDKFLGTIGNLGTYSFHETKNYTCGEGGAIVLNEDRFVERAEIIREKGTNRSRFLRGEVDKYTWVDIGSSYIISDVLAALLLPQLERIDYILRKREELYNHYYDTLEEKKLEGVKLPFIPKHCQTNYHCFYLILESKKIRDKVIAKLKEKGIRATFHYIPLHTSPMGVKWGYKEGQLPLTEKISSTIVRLPLYTSMSKEDIDFVINCLAGILNE